MVERQDVERPVIASRHHAASFELAVAADQIVGRAVVLELRLGRALELGDDALGQDLAQLHAPLIEGIDLPDRALGEDAVLVEGDELAQGARRQACPAAGCVGRPVALEDPVRHQPVRRAFGLHLLGGLAEGQRLGLGEDIGQQHIVMAAQRVQGLGEADEVAGDQPRALMDQLVEGMLAVGARLAPVDRAGVVVDRARRPASHACRCSPWSAAGGRRGSASDIARRAGRRPSGRRRNRCTRRRAGP